MYTFFNDNGFYIIECDNKYHLILTDTDEVIYSSDLLITLEFIVKEMNYSEYEIKLALHNMGLSHRIKKINNNWNNGSLLTFFYKEDYYLIFLLDNDPILYNLDKAILIDDNESDFILMTLFA